LDDAIDEYGINEFVGNDYSTELLSKQQILNCNNFIEKMKKALKKHWKNQNALYKNVVNFVDVVDRYTQFLNKLLTPQGKSNYLWYPQHQTDENIKLATDYRMTLCSLYKYQITSGRSLLILPNNQLEVSPCVSSIDDNVNLSTGFYSLLVGFGGPTYTSFDNTEGFFEFFSKRAFNDTGCNNDLNRRLAKLGNNEKNIIMSHPTIFAEDQGPSGDDGTTISYVGYVTSIEIVDNKTLKVGFNFIGKFNQSILHQNRADLNIGEWELSRTHWVMNQLDLANVVRKNSINILPID
jgi:hypothetical protein